MKLLVVTQTVDNHDPVLGFFVRWIEELAKHYEHVHVICLQKGEYALPKNVSVYSLGKERQPASRGRYVARFLSLVWKLRRSYDTVFVHMNQEYVVLGGWLWMLLGKRVSLWRNHYAGSRVTDVASLFCNTVFCTSTHSYTARYKKTVLMPVGVDTEYFTPGVLSERAANSILFLGRMAPSKRPELLIEALGRLVDEGISFSASLVGSPTPSDEKYYADLKRQVTARKLEESITFVPAVTNAQTRDLYRTHQIFVNASRSGMFDKTLFEAAACGCAVLASSKDFASMAGRTTYFDSVDTLVEALRTSLAHPAEPIRRSLVEAHSLAALGEKLAQFI